MSFLETIEDSNVELNLNNFPDGETSKNFGILCQNTSTGATAFIIREALLPHYEQARLTLPIHTTEVYDNLNLVPIKLIIPV